MHEKTRAIQILCQSWDTVNILDAVANYVLFHHMNSWHEISPDEASAALWHLRRAPIDVRLATARNIARLCKAGEYDKAWAVLDTYITNDHALRQPFI